MTAQKRASIILWTCAVVCLAAAGGVVVSIWLWPVKAPMAMDTVTAPVRVASNTAEAIGPLAAFEGVLGLNLRRPLIDPPATQPVQAPMAILNRPRTSSNIRLLGTAVEPGHSFGIFMVGLAVVEVRGVGQKTSTGAEVLEVTAKSAKVRQDGQVLTLALEDTSRPSAVTSLLMQLQQRRAAAAQGTAPVPPVEMEDEFEDKEDEPEEPVEIIEENAPVEPAGPMREPR